MTQSLYSPLWYRVADIRPRLRSHTRVLRHQYRGQRWYVLQDEATGSFHRFGPTAYSLIGKMNGEQTVDALWQQAVEQLGDDAPTQDQTIELLGQLHGADALQCEVPPDTVEIFQRQRDQRQKEWKQRLKSPLSIRIPLLDPQRWLSRCLPWVRPLFTRTGFVIWLGLVAMATVLAGLHWTDITENIVDRALAPGNLLILWLTYPLVKALHELGHAFATRVWGGEVHEMGIMFLVLLPIPYVDASAASAFADKRKRMLVGAAGIMVELWLAALALLVWINVEPGIVSTVCYNIMLIGGASTLFFNGNPLLRFDGYYVFADAVEIPNLSTRATRYIGYLIQHYLFGVEELDSPANSRGERVWFVLYGVTAFVYRMFIMCTILLYVAGKFFTVGIVLAAWAATSQVLLPLAKHTLFLFRSPGLRRTRTRALGTTGAMVAVIAGVLFLLPLPSSTRSEGVVWLPEHSRIRAGADCFVTRLLVSPGTRVSENQPVLRCEDPLLEAEVTLLEARLQEQQARLLPVLNKDQVEAEGIREKIAAIKSELAMAQQEREALVLLSPTHGRLVVPRAADLPGQYIRKGELVAYVLDGASPTVRVIVPQTRISLVRQNTEAVDVRFAGDIAETVIASIRREVPAATKQLPSKALGSLGGGRVAVDPQDEEGLKALQHIFQLDLELVDSAPAEQFGQRAYVRFDHGSETLASQWQRSLQQLFMRRFGV